MGPGFESQRSQFIHHYSIVLYPVFDWTRKPVDQCTGFADPSPGPEFARPLPKSLDSPALDRNEGREGYRFTSFRAATGFGAWPQIRYSQRVKALTMTWVVSEIDDVSDVSKQA